MQKFLIKKRNPMCVTFLFVQEQSSEPGRHGGRALHRRLSTSSPRPDVHGAARLRSARSHLGRLPHPCPHWHHDRLRHPVRGLEACGLLPVIRVQHSAPQGSESGGSGEILSLLKPEHKQMSLPLFIKRSRDTGYTWTTKQPTYRFRKMKCGFIC